MLESTMGNGGGAMGSIVDTMSSLPFRDGFMSVLKGEPLDYEAYPARITGNPRWPWASSDQWKYERGRQFALLYPDADIDAFFDDDGDDVADELVDAYRYSKDIGELV
jgi:hypothetical protein